MSSLLLKGSAGCLSKQAGKQAKKREGLSFAFYFALHTHYATVQTADTLGYRAWPSKAAAAGTAKCRAEHEAES